MDEGGLLSMITEKIRKFLILVPVLFLITGISAGLLLAHPWTWTHINGGYRIERETYTMLRERVQTDEAVMEADARYRVLFAMGYDEGLTDFYDMAGFRKSLKKENARRRDAIQNGQTVIGLTHFSASDYLDYMSGNLLLQLPVRLEENGTLSVSEEELRLYYEEHKEEQYCYVARATLEMLELDPKCEDLDEVLTMVGQDLLNGEDFKDNMAQYDPRREPFEMTIKENTKMHSGFRDLYELAIGAEPGVVQGPYSLNNGIVFFRLLSYEPGGITSFEDAQYYIRKDVMSQAFEQFLQLKIQKLTG